MANILCNNVDVDFLQQYAFYVPKKDYNPLVDCSSTYSLDLNLWSNQNATNQICPTTTVSTTTTSTSTTTTASVCSAIKSTNFGELQTVLGLLDYLKFFENSTLKNESQLLVSYLSNNESTLVSDVVDSNGQNIFATFFTDANLNAPSQYNSSTIMDLITISGASASSIEYLGSIQITSFFRCLSFPGMFAFSPITQQT
jgi:hypothetical protein